MIKPIETEYKGYRFRSRLEARWAVFFETVGVDWVYEPEGFDLGNGLYYLPDFLIRGMGERSPENLYVEVKGHMTEVDAKKIKSFANVQWGQKVTVDNPILVVGNIPNAENIGTLINEVADTSYNSVEPFLFNFELIDGDYYASHLLAKKHGQLGLFGDDSSYLTGFDEALTLHAYRTARRARFEHGEQG